MVWIRGESSIVSRGGGGFSKKKSKKFYEKRVEMTFEYFHSNKKIQFIIRS